MESTIRHNSSGVTAELSDRLEFMLTGHEGMERITWRQEDPEMFLQLHDLFAERKIEALAFLREKPALVLSDHSDDNACFLRRRIRSLPSCAIHRGAFMLISTGTGSGKRERFHYLGKTPDAEVDVSGRHLKPGSAGPRWNQQGAICPVFVL
jgi:hypothetical protein